jgi:hypothetical protein
LTTDPPVKLFRRSFGALAKAEVLYGGQEIHDPLLIDAALDAGFWILDAVVSIYS